MASNSGYAVALCSASWASLNHYIIITRHLPYVALIVVQDTSKL
jgi:hypothetical protein